MKFRKIVAFIACLALCFSFGGCNKKEEEKPKQRIIQAPYAYSANSKTLHHSGCYHVKRISDENLVQYYGDPQDMVNNGFKLCGVCFPNSNVNNKEDDSGIAEEDATYVINTATNKFHKKDCNYATSSSNTKFTDKTYEELIDEHYTPCQVCLKNYKGDNDE